MITIPFDVNDHELRRTFFDEVLVDCLINLPEETLSHWGKMTAQDMIEHLLWAFECSIGIVEVPCRTPVHLLDRTKRFLYDNRSTPQNYKNPLLGDDPLPHRYSTYLEAKSVLLKNIVAFKKYYCDHTEAAHMHPIFGLLNAEEWHRSHFKHCYHHLLQFGMLN
jgi:oxepin-CoA hydrolase / 3-oxo-5,6-dehydrosuberyl-CoA semialdehyde dehydrogenase